MIVPTENVILVVALPMAERERSAEIVWEAECERG
jgi:hypothetical protein